MNEDVVYVSDPVFAAALSLDRLAEAAGAAEGKAKAILLSAMTHVANILGALAAPPAKFAPNGGSVSPFRSL